MVISRKEIQDIYKNRAKRYDFYSRLFWLVGFRYSSYRMHAVELLRLKRGDCVVELGCGTGLNFPMLMERIGPEGKIIGVDLTSEMLACAQEKVQQSRWNNVELVQSDMANYEFPGAINGVLSTGAFGFVPEYEQVIAAASRALIPGSRLVILDMKRSDQWPSWLFNIVVWVGRPFGATHEYYKRRPWKSVERLFPDAAFEQKYAGLIYFSSGTASSLAA